MPKLYCVRCRRPLFLQDGVGSHACGHRKSVVEKCDEGKPSVISRVAPQGQRFGLERRGLWRVANAACDCVDTQEDMAKGVGPPLLFACVFSGLRSVATVGRLQPLEAVCRWR